MLALVRRLGVSDGSRADVFDQMVADLRLELAAPLTASDKRRTRLWYAWHFVGTLVAFGWSAAVKRLRDIWKTV
jgi:hypothetical protein